MAMSISRADVEELIKKYESAKRSAKAARDRAEDAVMTVVQTTEVAGTGFTLGAINGRFGGVEFLGIPLDLGLGAGLHLTAMFLRRPIAEHVHNFGDGALCAFATTLGSGVGREMAQRFAQSGYYPPQVGAGNRVSDEQLRSWAQRAA